MRIFFGEHTSIEKFSDIAPINISIKDIAHNLSMQCRYNGACPNFYSVAEHSVIVSEMLDSLPQDAIRLGLLHDAHEAYIGDIVRPVKNILGCSDFDNLSKKIDMQIFQKYSLGSVAKQWSLIVKEMDDLLLAIESQKFFSAFKTTNIPCYPVLQEIIKKYDKRIECLSPQLAAEAFIKAFSKLFPGERV